jgi:hypothetical protein
MACQDACSQEGQECHPVLGIGNGKCFDRWKEKEVESQCRKKRHINGVAKAKTVGNEKDPE